MTYEDLKNKIEEMNGVVDSLNYNLDGIAYIASKLKYNGWYTISDEEIQDRLKCLKERNFLKNFDKLTKEEQLFYCEIDCLRGVAVAISMWEDFPNKR